MPDESAVGRAAGRGVRPARRAAVPLLNGPVVDLTGPGLTDRWGVTCTDLGASVLAPNGKLVSVFGDTFSGRSVGEGDWRSPVVLIGGGDADHEIVYERAGDPIPTMRVSFGITCMTTSRPDGAAAASAR